MIPTAEALENLVDADLAWRRKELLYLKLLIKSNAVTSQQRSLIRTGIPILYAHWEGFVKKAATGYLEFVADKHCPYDALTPNFLAITLRDKIKAFADSNQASAFLPFIDFFQSDFLRPSNIPWERAVRTRANLDSSVLNEILVSIGIDVSP